MFGWEPGELTTYTYDGAGRLVSSLTVREPEFSRADVAWLLESRRQQFMPRGSHGLPLDEAMDPANQFAFEVPAPSMDWAAATLGKAEEAYRKAHPTADMHGVRFTVRRRSDFAE